MTPKYQLYVTESEPAIIATPISNLYRWTSVTMERVQIRAPDGPPPDLGLLVQTGLMIFLMVLDRSSYADGLVWTIAPNGPRMEFGM